MTDPALPRSSPSSARHAAALLVLAAGVAACAPIPKHPVVVAVLADGAGAPVVRGLELRPLVPPASPTPTTDDTSAEVVTRARAAYARGELDACRTDLASVDVPALLVRAERALAARALTLEAACAWGALAQVEARAAAARLASLGLELPDLVVAPDVEQVIGQAITEIGAAPRQRVVVTGVAGARLSVDGRPGGCVLPCSVELAPGEHVVAVDADGHTPAWRGIRVDPGAAPTPLKLAQPVASPALAAQQWRARLGRGLPRVDATGAALIARFGAEPRVVVLHGRAPLEGALIVDGVVRAQGARRDGNAARLVRDLAYDGGVLKRPAVWQRPWFWIALTGAVAVVGGVTVWAVYEPPIHTEIGP